MVRHPAKFNGKILDSIGYMVTREGQIANRELVVVDPFAGVGGVHVMPNPMGLGMTRVGVELEWEWAKEGGKLGPMVQGDALRLPFRDGSVDVVVTSPTYGNRMADKHNARDGSKRNTYTHVMVGETGHGLRSGNSGAMQWGEEYRKFHLAAWAECDRVLGRWGAMVLNVKNHVRKGVVQRVVQWHVGVWRDMDWEIAAQDAVKVSGLREGENYGARVEVEWVFKFHRRIRANADRKVWANGN